MRKHGSETASTYFDRGSGKFRKLYTGSRRTKIMPKGLTPQSDGGGGWTASADLSADELKRDTPRLRKQYTQEKEQNKGLIGAPILSSRKRRNYKRAVDALGALGALGKESQVVKLAMVEMRRRNMLEFQYLVKTAVEGFQQDKGFQDAINARERARARARARERAARAAEAAKKKPAPSTPKQTPPPTSSASTPKKGFLRRNKGALIGSAAAAGLVAGGGYLLKRHRDTVRNIEKMQGKRKVAGVYGRVRLSPFLHNEDAPITKRLQVLMKEEKLGTRDTSRRR